MSKRELASYVLLVEKRIAKNAENPVKWVAQCVSFEALERALRRSPRGSKGRWGGLWC